MLRLVTSIVTHPDDTLPVVLVRVDRHTLAKRIWRGVAEDGIEFGFELAAPAKHGDAVFASPRATYVIQQEPEPLLEVPLHLAPSAAAGIGWAVGNLHLELAAESSRLLTPDQPAARQLLARLGVAYAATAGIFRPGRFARGDRSSHELGPSHRH